MVFMESLHVTLQDTYDIKLIFEPCFWTKFLILQIQLPEKTYSSVKLFSLNTTVLSIEEANNVVFMFLFVIFITDRDKLFKNDPFSLLMVFMESLHVTLQDTYDINLIYEPCFWTKF
jgi:hypothetical protein